MRKSVFPRTRICTVLSEFPHVEIHKSMCKSAPRKYAFPHVEIHMRSCISACGNTPKIVNFPTCGNTHFLVYFHMRKFEREGEFPHVSLQADLWISAGKNVREYTFFADFRMRKYTRICEFPRAEIHAERCITACGNTLNQVQKNSSKAARLSIYWLDAACRLVIPLRQVALAQLNKYHHQSGNVASGKLVWNQHNSKEFILASH